jgi:hypothetical protein
VRGSAGGVGVAGGRGALRGLRGVGPVCGSGNHRRNPGAFSGAVGEAKGAENAHCPSVASDANNDEKSSYNVLVGVFDARYIIDLVLGDRVGQTRQIR